MRHRPVSRPAQGTPVILVPHFPKGRAERQGVSPRPRRHVRTHGLRVLKAHGENKASDADRRLRSARGWISRLAPCPRGCRLRRRAPFVRAVARTCTWTVRPCYRRLPPSALTVFSDLRRPERGIVAATRIPLRVAKTIATRPSIGTRRDEDIGPRREVHDGDGRRRRKL